mmetsp:Transcript_9675/g.13658  ORF Transcript_9675/g.13658 Transcript_9675/m.13658 type:complete len:89 (-) Transcript_9675:124-390(-)
MIVYIKANKAFIAEEVSIQGDTIKRVRVELTVAIRALPIICNEKCSMSTNSSNKARMTRGNASNILGIKYSVCPTNLLDDGSRYNVIE